MYSRDQSVSNQKYNDNSYEKDEAPLIRPCRCKEMQVEQNIGEWKTEKTSEKTF